MIGLLHHSSKPSTSYKRKIFLYDKGDLDSYRKQLTDVDWETMFGHDDVDTIVDIIANTRGGFRGERAGRAPPPKIRKAYVIQR